MPVDRIRTWADTRPDALAAVRGSSTLSYKQFLAAIMHFQSYIPGSTAGKGLVVIVTQDHLDAWLMSLAARALGHDAIVFQRVDLLVTLDLRAIHCVFCAASHWRRLQALGDALSNCGAVLELPHFTALESDEPSGATGGDRFGSQILYTTGTTGQPKWVPMDGELEALRNQYRSECFGVNSSTVVFTDMKPFSGAGFKTPAAVWHSGGAVIFDPALDLPAALRRYPVTSVLVGPNQLRALLEGQETPEELRHSFEITYTSGPLPYELACKAAEKLTRHINIYYGATELSGRSLASTFRELDNLLWLVPDPRRRVRVIDDEGGDCGVGIEGRLAIELVSVDAHQYLGDEESSRRVFRDGYFVPGDLAVKREDGRIRIVGREADVINIRGIKKSVQPIEYDIQTYLKAREVCIFAEMNEAGVDEALVAVCIDRDIQQSEMQHILREFLPFEAVNFARLNRFPKSDGDFGKTLRRELRKLLYASRDIGTARRGGHSVPPCRRHCGLLLADSTALRLGGLNADLGWEVATDAPAPSDGTREL